MKLVYPFINAHFDMGESSIPILVIENPKHFYKYLSEISEQINGLEGRFTLSEKDKILSLNKYAELIEKFIGFEINRKSLLSKLYNKLGEHAVSEDFYVRTKQINSEIITYLSALLIDFNSELEFDDEIEISGLFKYFGIKFLEDYTDLSEKLLNYMLFIREFDVDKCFIFVNLKSYLSTNDLEVFYKSVIDHKINILLFESINREALKVEKVTVIDDDLCEISLGN